MSIEILSEQRCHGGIQGFYQHSSTATGGAMRFSVFVPPAANEGRCPVLYFLAGLTCNEETFPIKAGAQRLAAELGLVLVAPDTSPRDTSIDGATGDWEFGEGAGFYVDATQPPWSTRFNMHRYVSQELPDLVEAAFPVDPARRGISGHSMGGHGALVMALRHQNMYASVSAFAPICHPTQCPWGHKAFSGYLGDDRAAWMDYDATELLLKLRVAPPMLVSQGEADNFLAEQLRPDDLATAIAETGVDATLERHQGYDHSYYFIASFVEQHLRFHAQYLL